MTMKNYKTKKCNATEDVKKHHSICENFGRSTILFPEGKGTQKIKKIE
jgi:hypothetical protein